MGVHRLFCMGCGARASAPEDTLKVCGHCVQYAYCSKECQVADWAQHKHVCGETEVLSSEGPAERARGGKTVPSLEALCKNFATRLEAYDREAALPSHIHKTAGGYAVYLEALRRRNRIQQRMFHFSLSQMDAVLERVRASENQRIFVASETVKGARIAARIYEVAIADDDEKAKTVNTAWFQQMHHHSWMAWTTVEIILGTHATTEAEMRARDERFFSGMTKQLLYGAAQKLARNFDPPFSKKKDPEAVPVRADLYAHFSDTTSGVAAETLRQFVKCYVASVPEGSTGATYPEEVRLNDPELEEAHSRVYNAVNRLQPAEGEGLWEALNRKGAAFLLDLAEWLESRGAEIDRQTRGADERERRRAQRKHTASAIWALRFGLSAVSAYASYQYYMHGVTSKEDVKATIEGQLSDAAKMRKAAQDAADAQQSMIWRRGNESLAADAMITGNRTVMAQMTANLNVLSQSRDAAFYRYAVESMSAVGLEIGDAGARQIGNITTQLAVALGGIKSNGTGDGPVSVGFLNTTHPEIQVINSTRGGVDLPCDPASMLGHYNSFIHSTYAFLRSNLQKRMASDPSFATMQRERRQAFLTRQMRTLNETEADMLEDLHATSLAVRNLTIDPERMAAVFRDMSNAHPELGAELVSFATTVTAQETASRNAIISSLQDFMRNCSRDIADMNLVKDGYDSDATVADEQWKKLVGILDDPAKLQFEQRMYPGNPFSAVYGDLCFAVRWVLSGGTASRYVGAGWSSFENVWVALRQIRVTMSKQSSVFDVQYRKALYDFAQTAFGLIMVLLLWWKVLALLGFPLAAAAVLTVIVYGNCCRPPSARHKMQGAHTSRYATDPASAFHCAFVRDMFHGFTTFWTALKETVGLLTLCAQAILLLFFVLNDLLDIVNGIVSAITTTLGGNLSGFAQNVTQDWEKAKAFAETVNRTWATNTNAELAATTTVVLASGTATLSSMTVWNTALPFISLLTHLILATPVLRETSPLSGWFKDVYRDYLADWECVGEWLRTLGTLFAFTPLGWEQIHKLTAIYGVGRLFGVGYRFFRSLGGAARNPSSGKKKSKGE